MFDIFLGLQICEDGSISPAMTGLEALATESKACPVLEITPVTWRTTVSIEYRSSTFSDKIFHSYSLLHFLLTAERGWQWGNFRGSATSRNFTTICWGRDHRIRMQVSGLFSMTSNRHHSLHLFMWREKCLLISFSGFFNIYMRIMPYFDSPCAGYDQFGTFSDGFLVAQVRSAFPRFFQYICACDNYEPVSTRKRVCCSIWCIQ